MYQMFLVVLREGAKLIRYPSWFLSIPKKVSNPFFQEPKSPCPPLFKHKKCPWPVFQISKKSMLPLFNFENVRPSVKFSRKYAFSVIFCGVFLFPKTLPPLYFKNVKVLALLFKIQRKVLLFLFQIPKKYPPLFQNQKNVSPPSSKTRPWSPWILLPP